MNTYDIDYKLNIYEDRKVVNSSYDELPVLKKDVVIDKCLTIKEDEALICCGMKIKDGVTVTVNGALIDLSQKEI